MLHSWIRDALPDKATDLSSDILIEFFPEPVVVLDRYCRILRCNSAFRDMCQCGLRRVVGERLGMLIENDAPTELYRVVLSAAREETGRVEVECVLPGLGPRTLQVSARLVGPNGTHPLVVVLHDNTDEQALDRGRSRLQMAEVAHRVKNSLQILASSVAFEQRREANGAGDGYRALHRRILAIASLYDVIGRSGDRDDVDARDLLITLGEGLRRSLLDDDTEVQIIVEAETASLPPRTAEAISLIINELATNAMKHAFPGGRGAVWLRLSGTPAEGLVLGVSDDGCGVAEEARSGVGSAIVKSLVTELKASMTRKTGPEGTEVTVSFPAQPRSSARLEAAQ